MRRVTRAEVEEMRARRFDPETIREAELSAKRTLEADELSERVRRAFSGVRLGSGVGLFEAQAIDDYAAPEVQQEKRDKDEKESWERILAKHLNACSSSLSFFDASGMRFHLPAFIIADLKGDFRMGMEFALTHLSGHSREQFKLLNAEQREVIREYLEFLRSDSDSKFHWADIDRALTWIIHEGAVQLA